MPEITDLDILVPEPKKAKLGGVEYVLPADLPMEIFLRMNLAGTLKNEDGTDDQPKQIQSLLDTLTELFTFELAEGTPQEQIDKVRSDVEKVLLHRGVKFCFQLIQNIYREDDEGAEEAAEADPTPEAAPPPPAVA